MTLPRLLYIGDVSIADTSAGEVLLYRLLQRYPADRLAAVCGVRPDVTLLPGVAYHHWGASMPRLLRSRVAREYILWNAWQYYEVPPPIAQIATMFKPDAILTISHVSAWLCAWQLAVRRNIPLHIIAHDVGDYADRFPRWSQAWAERKFGAAYRAAKSRLCITDTMAELYEERFGAPGEVIYPTRAGDPGVLSVAPRTARDLRSLTFGYGGSINTPSQLAQIAQFGRIAGESGHRLVVYTPQHAAIQAAVAAVPAIELKPSVPSVELGRRFRETVDCLFLPQQFDEADRLAMSTLFASKWTDYSVVGLPVLVWAPAWSSSARFVERYPGAAELITTSDPADVTAALDRLSQSPDYRIRLAEGVLAAGTAAFSVDAAWSVFTQALTCR
jgi:hypothetical protein